MAIQIVPLFLPLPEILLPLLGHHGLLPAGLADALFPSVAYGHGREYWRAYGLILAWPLNVYNVFTNEPLGWWLAISAVQTLVLIPIGIWFFGKGVYCGWICSCGALAETLGDTQRHKMPHGPGWNRLNLAGQGDPRGRRPPAPCPDRGMDPARRKRDRPRLPSGVPGTLQWIVDVFLAGVIGYGLYFWFSDESGAASSARSPRSCTSTRGSAASRSCPTRRSASPATPARRSATREST